MRLFWSKKDVLEGRAETLVSAARVNAISVLTVFSQEHPVLSEGDAKHSEFILTVASVFLAATQLSKLDLGKVREGALMDIVTERFTQSYPNQLGAFDDCKNFFDKEFDRLTAARYEARFIGSDALGRWIIWNILGRQPKAQNEVELVRAIGAAITNSFFNWWKGDRSRG